MSFDYNPLKHIEILESRRGTIVFHCHSCSADIGPLRKDSPISAAFDIARIHVLQSHNRTEADFEGWSIY